MFARLIEDSRSRFPDRFHLIMIKMIVRDRDNISFSVRTPQTKGSAIMRIRHKMMRIHDRETRLTMPGYPHVRTPHTTMSFLIKTLCIHLVSLRRQIGVMFSDQTSHSYQMPPAILILNSVSPSRFMSRFQFPDSSFI